MDGCQNKPVPLKKGDVVRVIAPASPFRKEKLTSGTTILEAFGLKVQYSSGLFDADDYLAGTDPVRSADLVSAFTDVGVAAVFPVRGGYGCARTCAAAGDPAGWEDRMVVGFSDVTALHLYLNTLKNLVTFHGPNITTLASLQPDELERYRKVLFGLDTGRVFSWSGLTTVSAGRSSGSVLAGNLTVLASLAGTPMEPDLRGKLLFVEDLNEKPYRLDRLLYQISSLKSFGSAAGVAFGDFMLEGEDCAQFERAVRRFADSWGVPVVSGFPMGHGMLNDCIPEGVSAELDADRGRVTITEDPYFRQA